MYLQDNKFQSNRGWFGGAIAAYSSTVVLLGQNLFQGNEAVFGGGVFASGSELVFRGLTTFIGNSALEGGGGGITAIDSVIRCNGYLLELPSDPDGLNMSCCEGSVLFLQNLAQFGGAMLLIGSIMQQTDGTLNFTRNMAINDINSCIICLNGFVSECDSLRLAWLEGSGGAVGIFCSNWSSTVVIFEGNNARGGGGAVYSVESQLHFGTPGTASHKESNSTSNSFVQNSAGSGGGMALEDSLVRHTGGTLNFTGNTAFSDGGAVYIEYSTWNSMASMTAFVNNTASIFGGAVYSVSSRLNFTALPHYTGIPTRAEQQHFTNNLSKVHVHYTFVNNSATHGGALRVSSSYIELNGNCNFSKNTAVGGGGGGISASNSEVHFYNALSSMMQKKTGEENRTEPNHLNGYSVTFSRNSAGSFGGGIESSNTTVRLSVESNFISNKAQVSGGGIYLSRSKLNVCRNANYISNTASVSGGAVSAIDSGAVVFEAENCFVNNWSTYGGGAISAERSDLVLSGKNTFDSNVAKSTGQVGYGGGIQAVRTKITVTGTLSFINNSARYGGGMAISLIMIQTAFFTLQTLLRPSKVTMHKNMEEQFSLRMLNLAIVTFVVIVAQ